VAALGQDVDDVVAETAGGSSNCDLHVQLLIRRRDGDTRVTDRDARR
jgi:hypothetical protein